MLESFASYDQHPSALSFLSTNLDGWEDVEGIVLHQGTLALRRLEDSLPGNTMETCSYSRYLLIVGKYTSYDLILIVIGWFT